MSDLAKALAVQRRAMARNDRIAQDYLRFYENRARDIAACLIAGDYAGW